MTVTSPFANEERAEGAAFIERLGVEMPEQYGNPASEYQAARHNAGLVDLSFRGMLQLTGGERLRWLNGQITNDVKTLQPGEGRPAAALNAKGHLVADLTVYGLADRVWVDLQRDREEAVRETFERHIIADDVRVETAGDRLARVMIVGPSARAVLSRFVGEAALDLPPWHHAETRCGDIALRMVANRRLVLPGVEVIAPIEAARPVWKALLDSGRAAGLRPVGMTALEWLRVEAGWPWFGLDFDEGNLLMESLSGDHVSFTKGCYVGQEVVTRIEHQGHLNKKLCGLRLGGETLPPRGSPIWLGDRNVGQVTSAVRSPALGRGIALGYLRRECWTHGTPLRIEAPPGGVEAEVTSLPFSLG